MRKLLLHFFLFVVTTIFLSAPLLEAQNEAAAKPLNGELRHWSLDYKYGRNFTIDKPKFGEVSISPSDSRTVNGVGATWYLNPNWSLSGGVSVELGSQSSEDQSGKQELSTTELGILAQLTWYPRGYTDYTWYGFGVYGGFNSFSDEQTFTPTTGDASTTKFSGSNIRAGLRAQVGFRPSENVDIEFVAGSNLGVQINPAYTITSPNGEEQEGPSSTYFSDCGGDVGVRWWFNHIIDTNLEY